MSRRCRVGPLRRLIGPAIVTIVHNSNDVIVEIQAHSAFFQFGKIPKYLENITQEIVSIKGLVNSGMPMKKKGVPTQTSSSITSNYCSVTQKTSSCLPVHNRMPFSQPTER
jgi:hypothetical protein